MRPRIRRSVSAMSSPIPHGTCDVLGYVTSRSRANRSRLRIRSACRMERVASAGRDGGFRRRFDSRLFSLILASRFSRCQQSSAVSRQPLPTPDNQGANSWTAPGRSMIRRSRMISCFERRTSRSCRKLSLRVLRQGSPLVFRGCSTGGREGLVEAQRYPADFDGVIAAILRSAPLFPASNWNHKHLTLRRTTTFRRTNWL